MEAGKSTRVSRIDVIQGLLDLFSQPHYLEIGVAKGATFHSVRAARKVGVDPKFGFDEKQTAAADRSGEYHRVTSDSYFGSVIKPSDKFNVIFLDGLHTSDQTLRDLLNAVDYLSPKGIIVIDDAIPISYPASLRDRQEFFALREALNIKGGSWMGDVFRLIFFIESFMQSWSYRVVSNNHGQVVMWKRRRVGAPDRTIEHVALAEYKDLFTQRPSLCLQPFETIVAEIKKYLDDPSH